MFHAFLFAFFICLALSFLFVSKTRFSDKPQAISKFGGLAIVISFFISSRLTSPLALGVLGGLGMTFLLGLIDDLFRLSPLPKLFAQIVISVFLAWGGVRTQIVFLSPLLNFLLTVLWFVALMNAFNFLDILDGLAAGISILCAITFLYICLKTGNAVAGVCAAALLGSNLAFLIFNFPSARLYMGDTGSLFNGMALGAIAVIISYAPSGREVALFVPLLILALPLSDLIFVIFMRFSRHKSIIRKSRDHFVLRLVDKGVSPPQAVFLMYIFNILFNVMALFLLSSSNILGFFIIGLTISAWLIVAYKISKE